MIELYDELVKKPEPVPEDSTDEKWKWFKHCLGAVDGAHIKVKVPLADQVRYRDRKKEITTNVLGTCSRDGQFTFILPGCEGSASNGRVLCDALRRHGLDVPKGQYYLVGSWFTSCEGFLAPFKGKAYRSNQTRELHYRGTLHECFNRRHSLALNVIKRCFGMLKLRWAILRDPPFYKAVRTYNLIIIACCLLQNLIRLDGADPLEDELVDMEAEIFDECIHKKRKYMNCDVLDNRFLCTVFDFMIPSTRLPTLRRSTVSLMYSDKGFSLFNPAPRWSPVSTVCAFCRSNGVYLAYISTKIKI